MIRPIRRFCVIAACAAGTLIGSPLAAEPDGAPSAIDLSDPAAPTPAHAASLLKSRLSALEHFSFEETATFRSARYLVVRHMSSAAFRTEVFSMGRLIYAISLADGQITEFLAKGGPTESGPAPQDMIESYPSPMPDGVDDPRLPESEFACTIGDALSTWIGPAARRPSRFHEMVSNCQQVRTGVVEGRECLIADFTDTIADDGTGRSRTIRNQYAIDSATGDLIRWESSQQPNGREAQVHVSLFRNIRTTPPEDSFVWRIEPGNLRRTFLPAPTPTPTSVAAGRTESPGDSLGTSTQPKP